MAQQPGQGPPINQIHPNPMQPGHPPQPGHHTFRRRSSVAEVATGKKNELIRGRRLSTDYMEKRVQPALMEKDNFLTIVPEGLPEDLIGDDAHRLERRNVLTNPRGVKNEGARLPPFKPFKTISDEDNIHLLPGETGERARLNLLDTKGVTKPDIEEVKRAYHRLRALYPELYQNIPHPEAAGADGYVPPALEHLPRKSFDEPTLQQHREIEQEERERRESFERGGRTHVHREHHQHIHHEEGSSSESSDESDSDEYEQPYPGYPGGGYPGYPPMGGFPGYGGMGFGGYMAPPGMTMFPGGYGMNANPYPMGFGPCQAPPEFKRCMEEVLLEKCAKIKEEMGSEAEAVPKRKKLTKKQGLNFDFLPHEDLATEVTFTIEPDEPEPLQYAVENGIMPIICCYMPSSLAMSPGQTSEQIPFSGVPTNASQASGRYSEGYGGKTSYTGHSSKDSSKTSAKADDEKEKEKRKSGDTAKDKDKDKVGDKDKDKDKAGDKDKDKAGDKDKDKAGDKTEKRPSQDKGGDKKDQPKEKEGPEEEAWVPPSYPNANRGSQPPPDPYAPYSPAPGTALVRNEDMEQIRKSLAADELETETITVKVTEEEGDN